MNYAALFGGAPETAPPTPPAPVAAYRLMFVDDEPGVLSALRRVFRQENYALSLAGNAAEALSLMEREPPFHLVISDFKMPGMHGADFLREVRKRSPATMRIMLTGQADTEAVMGAIKEGAVYRFILKPWNDDDLRVTVALALEQYELLDKNRRLEATSERQSRDLATMAKMSVSNRSQLAILLHKKGLVNAQQLQQLHKDMQGKKQPMIALLLDKGWLSEGKIVELLRKELLFEEVDLAETALDPAVVALVPRVLCLRQLILPLRVAGKRLKLAMADPMDMGLIEELGFSTGLQIHPVLARHSTLKDKLKEFFGEGSSDIHDLATIADLSDPFESIELVIEEDEAVDIEDLLASTDEPPAIRLVNAVIMEALRLRASDIHLQPRAKCTVVRYRIDGVLTDKLQIPSNLHQSVISRIKVMSELDITERRKPQDGRITVKTPLRIVDLRISTLPTLNGEKVVMRVLDRGGAVSHIEQLGLSEANAAKLAHVVTKPQGMILATGPTGSGKTTTLYAMLQHNASPQKNYVTIEDPVEFYMDMAGQVPVKERVGLSFATVLRAILRQDPDVILLGEIRDTETAEVAFHAAMTGHVVYSTLHTNSAVATVARLLDLGLKPFIIAAALEAVIAQRLLRRLCPHCRHEAPPPKTVLEQLGAGYEATDFPFFEAPGCGQCTKGYSGRVGIYEILSLDETLREAITQGEPAHKLLGLATARGMSTLLEDAHDKLAQGLTTAEEILRVFGAQRLI
ncbi:MAG: Flp pilus assembly complex ATPase component TadA [Gammaproteobacteria bacterium]|nr:Flp pilus assembly complex ATPase component TadA [Gammaproteobacteria bacterium]